MKKLFDVSVEEAFYIDTSESILVKLSSEFSEVNIYFPKNNIQEFEDFVTQKIRHVKSGFILDFLAIWKREKSDIYLLIGNDEDTWDIYFMLNEETLLTIRNKMKEY